VTGPSDVARAVSALRAGGLAVIPTDTVYGVAAKLDAPDAIEALFRVKGRPQEKPVPVLAAGVDQLRGIVHFDGRALCLTESFWPGPLTLVLPRAHGFSADLGGRGAAGVGVRVPNRRATLELLEQTGPLAVTSANRSGRPPAATADEARAALGGEVDFFLDDGPASGSASTVVSLIDGVEVLRDGPVTADSLRECLERARS
jgi:L-threonylcarbamoyladenylate synthase